MKLTKDDILKIMESMAVELADKYNYKTGELPETLLISETSAIWYQHGSTGKENDALQGGFIKIRRMFFNYRIVVHLPNQAGFASLEYGNYNPKTKRYSKYFKYKASQIFKAKGIVLFNELRRMFRAIAKEIKGMGN
jgi:hypothetical protein